MGIATALLLIVAGCIIDSVASAEDLCPAGPFETEVGKIAAAMVAEPLEPNLPHASNANSDTPQAARLTDGAIWTASGGLGAHGQLTLAYDAKRYIVRDIEEEWPQRDILDLSRERTPSEPPKAIPQQVIRKIGEVTTTTTVARPTPEQARTFACLANRLMAPPDQKSPARSPESSENSRSRPEITVSASPLCTEVGWFSDAHVEGFSLLVSGGSVLIDKSDLSCAARYELRSQMKDAVYASIKELTARGSAN